MSLPPKNQDRKLSQLRVTLDNQHLTFNMVVVLLLIIGVSLAGAQGDAPGKPSFIQINQSSSFALVSALPLVLSRFILVQKDVCDLVEPLL